MEVSSSFVKDLYESCDKGEWRKVLKLGENASLEERKRYLWSWPTEQNLKELKSELDKLGVRSLASIGCGTGLLEFLMHKCTGMQITGIEVDEFYWVSANAPKPFIDLFFAKRHITSTFYGRSCSRLEKYGLLFCYFNNPRAFADYVRHFIGEIIVMIGPSLTGTDRVCDPMPERPDFENEKQWSKCYMKEFGNNKDVVVIWKRNL